MVKRVLQRVVSVPREELEVAEIISGRPLSELVGVLGFGGEAVNYVELSSPAMKGDRRYIAPRAMHLQHPLISIAEPLNLEVWVRFYEVNNIPVYFVDEPPVTDMVKKLYVYLRSRISEIGLRGGDVLKLAREVFEDLGVDPDYAFSDDEVKTAIYYVWRDLLNYGPLEIPMEDVKVEEISWYAHDGIVLVVDKDIANIYPNAEFVYTNITLPHHIDENKKLFLATQVIRAITSKARSGLTVSKPLSEARIRDPSGRGFHRLAAHLDIVSRSPGLTIRKFPPLKLSLTSLISSNTLSELEAAYLLYQLIKRGFILIVGGMASGKTTLLQALISSLPISYKVVTIEDTPELSTPAQNWHPLYVRRAPKESELENVDFSRLVIHSLRHRGTVVTLGEVRGAEMADLIQAAASGHGAICLRPSARLVVRIGGKAAVTTMRDVYRAFLENPGGVEALSIDLSTGALVWRRITNVFRTLSPSWIRIYTASGRILEMTPDHRLPVITESGAHAIKKAWELRVGDSVIVPAKLPRTHPVKNYIIVGGVYIHLDRFLGRQYAAYLKGRKSRRGVVVPLDSEISIPYLAKIGVSIAAKKKSLLLGGQALKIFERLDDTIKMNPLSLPTEFLRGVAEGLGRGILDLDEELAHALHFALKTVGVDTSILGGNSLVVNGFFESGVISDPIVRIEVLEGEDEEAYDIEVDGTHTFVTDSSIVSMNCTFHAHDPESVLARITSPPINAAPESLRLITSIVHIAYTKTYARSEMGESVRRVKRIFEIYDVKGRTPISSTVFEWDPRRDTHNPSLFYDGKLYMNRAVETLTEIWVKSKTLKILGETTYGRREPYRILSDILALAIFLRKQIEAGVFDIKRLLMNLTAFYLIMDGVANKLWGQIGAKLEERIMEVTKERGEEAPTE